MKTPPSAKPTAPSTKESAKQTAPSTKESAKETAPSAKETAPSAKETTPSGKETAPSAKETAPSPEKTTPLHEKTAQALEKASALDSLVNVLEKRFKISSVTVGGEASGFSGTASTLGSSPIKLVNIINRKIKPKKIEPANWDDYAEAKQFFLASLHSKYIEQIEVKIIMGSDRRNANQFEKNFKRLSTIIDGFGYANGFIGLMRVIFYHLSETIGINCEPIGITNEARQIFKYLKLKISNERGSFLEEPGTVINREKLLYMEHNLKVLELMTTVQVDEGLHQCKECFRWCLDSASDSA